MSDEILNEIKGLLVEIRSILLISNTKEIEEYKNKFLSEKSEQVKIYNLCTNSSTEDIVKKIKKDE